MSIEGLFLIDPYNEKHILLLENFEKENNIQDNNSQAMREISLIKTKKEYQEEQKSLNEVKACLCLEKNKKIIDYCLIKTEKDRKIVNIRFPKLNKTKRQIIKSVIDYSIKKLGMEEVFILVSPQDKKLLLDLEKEGLENLGEEKGNVIFLKEKEFNTISQRMIA